MTDMTPPAVVGDRNRPLERSALSWMRDEFDRLLNDGAWPERIFYGLRSLVAEPVPAVQLAEKPQEYQLTAELAGLDEKDVTIEVAGNVLTISGEKKEEVERKECGCVIDERRYGSFTRQVTLPRDANPDMITASFDKGLLTITIAKNETAVPSRRKIAITA